MNKRVPFKSLQGFVCNKPAASSRLKSPRLVDAVAVVFLSFVGARAAIADSRIITFDEAVRIALQRNASLRQAENAAELSDVAVREARMQFVPDLRLSTSGSESFGRNFDQSEGRIIDQSTGSM